MTFHQHDSGGTPVDLFPVTYEAYLRFLISRPKQAHAFADRLIEELDALDGDPDLEETADDELTGDEEEPTLGAPEVEFSVRGLPQHRGHIDQRNWNDGRFAVDDGETTLGWPELGDRRYVPRDALSMGYESRAELDECEVVSEDEGADIQAQLHDGDDVGDACTIDDMGGETSLGSLDRHIDQTAWAMSGGWWHDQGAELDRSDYESTAPERAGKGFVRCSPDDIEENGDERDGPSDNGIADQDGAAEQWGYAVGGNVYA